MFPEPLLTKLQGRFKQSSIITQFETIKRWYRLRGTPFTEFNIVDFNYADCEKIANMDSVPITARRCIINNVLVVLRASLEVEPDEAISELVSRLKPLLRVLTDRQQDEYVYKPPSKKEVENIISWGEVLELRRRFDVICGRDFTTLVKAYYCTIARLLLWLYTEIPPLRGSEYLNAMIEPDDEEKVNVINLRDER
jgi:hypothetical protein